MDIRGLEIQKHIYDFETRIYHLYDLLPKKHKYTLAEHMILDTIEMRRACRVAIRIPPTLKDQKATYFGMSFAYAEDVQEAMDHLYDMQLMTDKQKASMDTDLGRILKELQKLSNSFNKQLLKRAGLEPKEADSQRSVEESDLH